MVKSMPSSSGKECLPTATNATVKQIIYKKKKKNQVSSSEEASIGGSVAASNKTSGGSSGKYTDVTDNKKKVPTTDSMPVNKASTKGPRAISKKEKLKEKICNKIPRMHQLKKVRFPVQVKIGLSHIFDQLVTCPDKKLAAIFVDNGVADTTESRSLAPMEASKKRKERAVSFYAKTVKAFAGREAANTLMVVFYNPASVSVLMEEIRDKGKFLPAHVLVVRFHTAFVVIITEDNIFSRFPFNSWMENADSSSCFLWFHTKGHQLGTEIPC
jgi:hypothetical protein